MKTILNAMKIAMKSLSTLLFFVLFLFSSVGGAAASTLHSAKVADGSSSSSSSSTSSANDESPPQRIRKRQQRHQTLRRGLQHSMQEEECAKGCGVRRMNCYETTCSVASDVSSCQNSCNRSARRCLKSCTDSLGGDGVTTATKANNDYYDSGMFPSYDSDSNNLDFTITGTGTAPEDLEEQSGVREDVPPASNTSEWTCLSKEGYWYDLGRYENMVCEIEKIFFNDSIGSYCEASTSTRIDRKIGQDGKTTCEAHNTFQTECRGGNSIDSSSVVIHGDATGAISCEVMEYPEVPITQFEIYFVSDDIMEGSGSSYYDWNVVASLSWPSPTSSFSCNVIADNDQCNSCRICTSGGEDTTWDVGLVADCDPSNGPTSDAFASTECVSIKRLLTGSD